NLWGSLRRFGKTSSIEGDKLKIYKGDLVFAKRNAYLKRVAIAEFDAVASAHSLVLRAKSENVLPEFLPFFLLSETFWEKAIEISVGSLSPTINWSTIAKQEFLLPPKEQQAELAELLWAMDGVIESELAMFNRLKTQLDCNIEFLLHGIDLAGQTIKEVIASLSKTKGVVKLKDCGVFLKGKGIPKSVLVESGVPCIRYGEIYTAHHRIIREYHSFISPAECANSIRLKKNDVIFAGSGETITEIGKSAVYVGDDEVYAGSDTLIFRPEGMDGLYLGYLMNSVFVRQQLNMYGTGATVMHIYLDDLKKIVIPIHSFEEQKAIGKELELIWTSIHNVLASISKAKALQKSLINEIF
ncbi:restriction endonuclease subunit S, partial [Alishewanella sp. HH-ZS]|uniref:restriction endonuclease subunit S n=1 Tax=Alishewanella sp. HH-ZS TaxID=1856684 RepID=UPI0008235CBE